MNCGVLWLSWIVSSSAVSSALCLCLPLCEHGFSAEESARHHGEGFIEAADAIVDAIDGLYVGVEMPKSDFSMKSIWG